MFVCMCVKWCDVVFGSTLAILLDKTWPCFAKGPVAWLPKWTSEPARLQKLNIDCI